MEKTQVQITREVWEKLNQERRLGESFNKIIERLLNHWKEQFNER